MSFKNYALNEIIEILKYSNLRVDCDCERCRDDVNPKCTIMLAISYRAISTDILRQTALLTSLNDQNILSGSVILRGPYKYPGF